MVTKNCFPPERENLVLLLLDSDTVDRTVYIAGLGALTSKTEELCATYCFLIRTLKAEAKLTLKFKRVCQSCFDGSK